MASSEGEAEEIREAYDDDFEDEEASDEDLAAQAQEVVHSPSPDRPPRPPTEVEAPPVVRKASGSRPSVEHRSHTSTDKVASVGGEQASR
eukprot:symbB.v1.2.003574.t1/scaffold204.1/size273638/23